MTFPSTVRLAVPDDRDEIWRLFLMGHHENAVFKLAPEKVDFFLTRALYPEAIPPGDLGPRGAVGVIGKVGALEALAFVIFGNFWYSNERHLEELLVYVDPEHRKSNHAKAMIQWMKDQADLLGIPLVTGIISNERTEAKVRLYERMLPKIGAFFLYSGKGSIVASSSAAFA